MKSAPSLTLVVCLVGSALPVTAQERTEAVKSQRPSRCSGLGPGVYQQPEQAGHFHDELRFSRSGNPRGPRERARTPGLFVRDVANMGASVDTRTLRVAVKDRKANFAMVEILRITLAEMASERSTIAACDPGSECRGRSPAKSD